MYRLVLFHIVTHGFVKASAFVNSGWHIHMQRRQDLRMWGLSMGIMVMTLGFLLLCGVRGSLVASSKEYILLGVFGIFVMVMGWNYSKNFMNNVDRVVNKYMMESRFLCLIVLLRGSRFMSIDVVLLTVVCLGMRVVTMGNM